MNDGKFHIFGLLWTPNRIEWYLDGEKVSLQTLKQKYKPHIPNIDAIPGALITLSLSILILNSQCEEGARDGIDIWYMWIITIN